MELQRIELKRFAAICQRRTSAFSTPGTSLETHTQEIAKAIGDFWDARFVRESLERTELNPA